MAKSWALTIEDKVEIPGFPKHYIDIFGNIYIRIQRSNADYFTKLKVFVDNEDFKYTYLGPTRNKKRRWYIIELLEKSYPKTTSPDIIPFIRPKPRPEFINRPTGESRVKLDRARMINHLLKLTPTPHIHLNQDKDGIYHTHETLLDLGIKACSSCGYFQPSELSICKFCGEWSTK